MFNKVNTVEFVMEDLGKSSKFFHLYRNTVTDVLYIYSRGVESMSLVEMRDPETGLPLTYKKYLELSNKLQF